MKSGILNLTCWLLEKIFTSVQKMFYYPNYNKFQKVTQSIGLLFKQINCTYQKHLMPILKVVA